MIVLSTNCPTCGMEARVAAARVRIVALGTEERIGFDCDDCGSVTRPVGSSTVDWLVTFGGMPGPFVKEQQDAYVAELWVEMTDLHLSRLVTRWTSEGVDR